MIEPESEITYSYKFNRGFLEKVETKQRKVTEVVYVYDCVVNIENSIDEELTNLLKIKKDKEDKESYKKDLYTNYNSNVSLLGDSTIHKHFIDNWADTEIKVNPRDPRFKPKPHKQTELFAKPSIKELTTTFLTALMLQDDDLEFSFSTTYQQAVESWNEEVGEEMIKEFCEYVEQIIGEVFDNIFGEVITEEELRDIKINVNIILGSSIQETSIKSIIKNYLNSLV